jgi:hypothetical protein
MSGQAGSGSESLEAGLTSKEDDLNNGKIVTDFCAVSFDPEKEAYLPVTDGIEFACLYPLFPLTLDGRHHR